MAVVYIALGSNVGDGNAYFDCALSLLEAHISSVKESTRITTKPWGYTDQPDFLNSVIRGGTELSPHQLLDFTQRVEQEVGRIKRFRWGPREIDIDIIFYDDLVLDEPKLMIPHKDFANREFVLAPLIELNRQLVDPRSGNTIEQLYAAITDKN